MQGGRVKKYEKLHDKQEHFDENLEESKDIFNHGEGTKTCELKYTFNRDLSTFFGASNTFLFIKIGSFNQQGHNQLIWDQLITFISFIELTVLCRMGSGKEDVLGRSFQCEKCKVEG